MTTEIIDAPVSAQRASIPLWYWSAASLGLAWNAFGIVRFVGSATASEADMLSQGMTAEQAELYASLPSWMDAAFAFGVFGGVIGCILLVSRSKLADAASAMAILDATPIDRRATYQPYWATLWRCLLAIGRISEARTALDTAIGLTEHPAVRAYLLAQQSKLID